MMLDNTELSHDDLLSLHDKAYNNGYDTRLKAADDMLFAWVTQWDDTYLSESDLGYRGEFNILRKAMRQILTDLISNPVQVDFEPIDDTDDNAADIIDGMYRSDMRNNVSQEAKKNANQESVVCGVGAWELRNEYKTSRMGDERQIIKRYPLYEANNNVMWDPNAKLLDKSDASYVSCLVAYSEDGYKQLRKELTGEESDVIDSNFGSPEISYVFPWISETKKVYVSRFFHRTKKTIKYLTYTDMFNEQVTIEKGELKDKEEELALRGATLTGEKEVTRYQVTRYIASGEGILEAVVIPGEHIPVIPQYGERQFVEGEEHYEGIVRLAKDPQRLRNFQMSYLADIVSRSPREKPIFTQDQIGGYEDMYEEGGADNNLPYLKQNAFDLNGNPLPVGPVGYIKAPEVPPALMASMPETRAAVDDVAGAALPADITDVDLSGKALNSLNKRLDMQSYTYQDNHKFAMRRDGEIYASMMADIKDIEEEVVLIKFDGTKTTEVINKQEIEFDGTGVVRKTVNDMSSVSFDVYADIGPSFESVKAQNKEEIKELLNGMDPTNPKYGLLLNEYLMMTDGMAFKDLREYVRKEQILSGYKEPETEEDMLMLQQAQAAAQSQQDPQMMLAAAEAEARINEGQAAMQNEVNDANKIAVDQFNAETKRLDTIVKAQKAGVDIENTEADTQSKYIDNAQKMSQSLMQRVNA